MLRCNQCVWGVGGTIPPPLRMMESCQTVETQCTPDSVTGPRDRMGERHPVMLERPRFLTKQEMVHATLREAIMTCTLQPGQRLVIDDIARQLGVSHIPVREAIQQLQSERLVIAVPHTGTTVAPVTRDSLRETFVLMEGLETVSAEIAATELSAEGLARLARLIDDMDDAITADDVQRWSEGNAAFHREIAAAAAMPALLDILSRTFDHWDRIRRHFGIVSSRLLSAQDEHRQILAALQDRDAEAIRVLARTHARTSLAAYLSALDSGITPECPTVAHATNTEENTCRKTVALASS